MSTQRDPVREQLERLPDIVRAASARLADETRATLSTEEHVGLQFVLLTGCGDSAIAGRAASFAWHALAGVPAFHLDAMTAARFYAGQRQPWRPGGQLVLAVSSSGGVARVVEAAVELAGAPGTIVCAATANPSSPLAAAAERRIDTSVGEPVAGPGVASYVVSVLGLLHLAIRSGEVRGRYTMDEANRLREELGHTSDALAATLESLADPVRRLADDWRSYDAVEFLGSGAARASAAFGAAKILEAAGLRSMDQDVEEFMHLQYFERAAERTPTMVICPSASTARGRAAEVERYVGTLRRPRVVLSDDASWSGQTLHHAPAAELFAPIVHAAAVALLAVELAELHGEVAGRGGAGQWADSKNGAAVRVSS